MNKVRLEEPLWYHEPWPVILSLLFFPPVGLFLLWVSRRLSLAIKVGVTGFFLVTALSLTALDMMTGYLSNGAVLVSSWEAFYRARGLYKGKLFKEALPHALRAYRQNPESRRVASLVGLIQESLGNDKAAEVFLRASAREMPSVSVIDLIPRLDKSSRKIRREFKQTLLGSRGDALRRLVSFLLYKNRPVDEIDSILDLMVKEHLADPASPSFCLARARVALRQKRYQTATRFARQVIDAQEYGKPTSQAYEVLASVAVAKKKPKDALSFLAFAMRHRSGSTRLRRRLLLMAKECKEPIVPWVAYAGATRLARYLDGGEQALPILRKLWESHKGKLFRVPAAFSMGSYAFYETKNWDDAATAFEQAASVAGEAQAKAQYFAGRSHQEAKRIAPARKRFHACLEQAPTASKLARWARYRLEELEEL